jgi:hypothetical protein
VSSESSAIMTAYDRLEYRFRKGGDFITVFS